MSTDEQAERRQSPDLETDAESTTAPLGEPAPVEDPISVDASVQRRCATGDLIARIIILSEEINMAYDECARAEARIEALETLLESAERELEALAPAEALPTADHPDGDEP